MHQAYFLGRISCHRNFFLKDILTCFLAFFLFWWTVHKPNATFKISTKMEKSGNQKPKLNAFSSFMWSSENYKDVFRILNLDCKFISTFLKRQIVIHCNRCGNYLAKFHYVRSKQILISQLHFLVISPHNPMLIYTHIHILYM